MPGSDDNRDVSHAATVQSSADGSLDETLPSSDVDFDLTKGTTGPASDEPVIERGTNIGRYVVLDRLGSGTMGVVMSAIDPTLDRKVAIKLVRADRSGSTAARQRLLREAQAMARLAHPNVVTVFEVGMFGERVFLAMEYIAGSTLAAWLPKRMRREIIGAFLSAGHGLAAAHRAGIVHRDFKPANVLVASDGRVRVADFGLATAPEARARSSPPVAVEVGEMAMTSTGAILGTPAYMSPEQHRGKAADARADQFSFCLAMYEALYGELPFEGNEYLVYADNVLAGRIREAPRGSNVPTWLRKILVRGMAVEPTDRYPDMDALLADLARDPIAMRKRVGLVAAGAVVIASLAAIVARGGSAADPCAAAEQPLAQLWSASARATLEEAFTASGTANANDTFKRTTRIFDERAVALRTMRRDACLATAVRHEQSADLLDRRMQCIEQRASEMATLISVLSDHPDATVVDKSIEAAMRLTPIPSCADRTALLAEVPPPSSPDVRVKVAALDQQLDRARALEEAGKYSQGLTISASVVPEADHLDYARLRARARFVDADIHEDLAEHEQAAAEFRQAGDLAAAAHDDKQLAKAWIMLYATLGFRLGHVDQAQAFEPSVVTAVVRSGDGAELRGQLDTARCVVDMAAGDYSASAEHCASAVRELSQALGPNHPAAVSALSDEGSALEGAGRYEDARQTMERALAIRIETQGAEHPDVARSYYQLGSLLDTMQQPDKALADFEKSAAIDTKAFGSDSPEVATDYVSLGVVLDELDRVKEALDDQERAIAIFDKHPQDNAAKMSVALLDLGNTYGALKRYPDAMRMYQRAIDIATKTVGADHEEVADVLVAMGSTALYTGDRARARELWRQALAIREKRLGADHPDVAKVLVQFAAEAYDRKAFKETLPLVTRAIAIYDKLKGQTFPVAFEMLDVRGECELALHEYPATIADMKRAHDGLLATEAPLAASARLSMAKALWEQGAATHEQAVTEAHGALDEMLAQAKPDPDDLADARKWLASHHASK